MELPTAFDLRLREGLVPIGELAERLAEAIAAVEKHERKAVVTLTYAVEYDEEFERLTVTAAIKAKRPVKPNRNEEVIGDGEIVLGLRREIPGQQKLDPHVAAAVGEVKKLDRFLKDNGASMTVKSGDSEVTIGATGKDAAAGG